MNQGYCRCGYPILVDAHWNRKVEVLVFRDGRTGSEISECPGCGESETAWLELCGEVLRLREGALLDEAPKTWTWWMPTERILAIGDESGRIDDCLVIPTDVVVCDLCNASILQTPVPILWDGYAVCEKCFRKLTGLPLEQAAERDHIVLATEEKCKP